MEEVKKKTARKTPAKKVPVNVEATETVASSVKKKMSLPKVDLNDLCEVTSCFIGEVVYKSRSGFRMTWGDYGATQYLPVSELLTMRNEQPKFFINNLIKLTGDNAEAVSAFLQIDKYYKPLNDIGDVDEVFEMEPEEIPNVLGKLTDSMKENVARRAYMLIQNGEIDSKKTIDALSNTLGFDLNEEE